MIGRLNLATRPARNERLPALLFTVAALALLALTVQHLRVGRRLLSSDASQLAQEAATLDAQLASLQAQAVKLRATRPDPTAARQWVLLKALVDRRAFSWTELLARLEAVLPADIKLVSISPDSKEGRLKLLVEAVARTTDRALELVKALLERREFTAVALKSLTADAEGVHCRYEMDYVPGPHQTPQPPGTGSNNAAQGGDADKEVDP